MIEWSLALVLAAVGGWPVTAGVLRLAARSADAGPTEDPPAQARAVLRGGTWIGALERTGVALAVLAGQPTAIAFVIAVKGLGRYPELRTNPEASERFVIGTLASMIWAISVTLAVSTVLG